MAERKKYSEKEREEVFIEFVEKTKKKFRKEEAEGISFSVGNYISDFDLGIIIKIDDGKLEQYKASKEEVELCDMFLSASLDVFSKLDNKEKSVSDLVVSEENIHYDGDLSLLYELYNILDIVP